jgi:hypothetical protein
MKKVYILFSIVVAIAMLLSASEVIATEDFTSFPSPGISAPLRECTISVLGGTVKIQAGPNLSEGGGLSTQFPIPYTCVGDAICPCGDSSSCLQWQYRWAITGCDNASLVTALVSVDSDITVLSSDSLGAKVSKIIPILAEGERFLTFPVSGGTTFTASYFTPVNVTPGTLTAGFAGKKGWLPLLGRCALAGADSVIVQKNQAVADEQTFHLEGCTVAFKVDIGGKVIPNTMHIIDGKENCTFEGDTNGLEIDGLEVVFVGSVQFTLPGSCSYCFTNTAGGRSCTTCTACCISSTTGACVLKNTLSNPATQCKAGTYP